MVNWSLILVLSSSGVVMGSLSVLGYTQRLELLLWLIIAAVCAKLISGRVGRRQALHGFLVGGIAGGIAPLIQVFFFATYAANNPEFLKQFESEVTANIDPRSFLLLLTPFIALISGLVLSLVCLAGAKLFPPSK